MNKYQKIWNQVIKSLKNKIREESYNEIIKPANKVYKFENNCFYIISNSYFHKNRLEELFYGEIIKEIINTCNEAYEVKFIVEEEIEKELEKKALEKAKVLPKLYRGNLNQTYTFNNYVIGNFNRLASTLSLKVAEQPGIVANPLYIFGDSGLGKTHLMQAIGNYVLENQPEAKVLYIKTQMFIEEFISSLRNQKDSFFSEKFREVDVLLIDDIQFLSSKEETQLEFFKIFEELYNQNKQIVVTSDRLPSKLRDMMDRLTSRFEWGMLVDIKKPELQNRIEILKKKVQAEKINFNSENEEVGEDILIYIAKIFNSNIRKLESALKRVIYYSAMLNKECTLELAKEALKEIEPEKDEKVISINEIIERVCSYYKITKEQIISKSRKKEIILPRQIAMYLIRDMLNAPYKKISYQFDNKHHSSIINSVNKIELELKVNKELEKAILDIKNHNFDF